MGKPPGVKTALLECRDRTPGAPSVDDLRKIGRNAYAGTQSTVIETIRAGGGGEDPASRDEVRVSHGSKRSRDRTKQPGAPLDRDQDDQHSGR